jgi:alanine dehydrogenase
MRIGVPNEIKTHEYRVGLTPAAVREYVTTGHSVIVETNAGAGIGAADEVYRKAGAVVVDTAAQVFATADMIVKVKEPQPSEWSQLREGQILFTYLHLAPNPEQAKGLIASGCTAIAYETVTDTKGGLPLLAPMSEVAGRLSIEAAGAALKRYTGGRGLLIGGVPGVQPARVVVIGGGVVGTHAREWLWDSVRRSLSLTARFPACVSWTSCSRAEPAPASQRSRQSNRRFLPQMS